VGKALLVIGLGYGDEGKGSCVDYLVRHEKSPLVVRFNGGAQAAHHVVCDDGRHHTFSQFGSGTFAGARTLLSRFMLFNPMTLVVEARHLAEVGITEPLRRVSIELDAVVTTPYHWAANRLIEMSRGFPRTRKRHGSCGMGIGETMGHYLERPEEALYVRNLCDNTWIPKFRKLREYLSQRVDSLWMHWQPCPKEVAKDLDIFEDPDTTEKAFAEALVPILHQCHFVHREYLDYELARDQTVIFEGAQGVLLDQDYGWVPHNTWSDCTFGNAWKLLEFFEEATTGGVQRIGVVRGYMTRHGAGPFVTEDSSLPMPQGEHNGDGLWQQSFRLGHFDSLAIRYALEVIGGVDHLALTCLDHLKTDIRSCTRYTGRYTRIAWDGIPILRPLPVVPFDATHQHEQENLTRTLFLIEPTYETLPDVESFVSHVETQTKTPVKLCSFGPRASDKRAR
jgi:adenylosuccinate synthase